MNDILIGLTLVSLAGMFILRSLFIKQKNINKQNEEVLRLIRKIYHLDELISRLQRENPTSWAKEDRAQTVIARRIELHEEYCTFVGGYPVREVEYMNGLMGVVVMR
ncbi:MAG: hypothetical protein RLZZ67_352 [Candidatus Parcubacteria bacterium]|jgi:hypothetical protein